MIQVFKLATGLEGIQLESFFKKRTEGSTRGHSCKLEVPLAKGRIRRQTFSVRVVRDWNSLPQEQLAAMTPGEHVNPHDAAYMKKVHSIINARCRKIRWEKGKSRTSEVTRKKIQDSRGGVLLIDEAYRLAQADSSSKDVGKEAMEELMGNQPVSLCKAEAWGDCRGETAVEGLPGDFMMAKPRGQRPPNGACPEGPV
ncbi:Set1/Ash2 histone methyltransferase complex subunit ASH2 [Branchiostoma belcheri]|nr:Set1/Ash2 histone methyltransferase complex subunit ASH2 [Branchiostoma belcheri]